MFKLINMKIVTIFTHKNRLSGPKETHFFYFISFLSSFFLKTISCKYNADCRFATFYLISDELFIFLAYIASLHL